MVRTAEMVTLGEGVVPIVSPYGKHRNAIDQKYENSPTNYFTIKQHVMEILISREKENKGTFSISTEPFQKITQRNILTSA